MSMPNEIELPEAKDFCRGAYRNGSGQCCFMGWKQTLFPNLTDPESRRFRAIAGNEAKKMRLNDDGSYIGPTTTNDNRQNTKEQLAKWFAQTVRVFGYDIS